MPAGSLAWTKDTHASAATATKLDGSAAFCSAYESSAMRCFKWCISCAVMANVRRQRLGRMRWPATAACKCGERLGR
ncbi:hypothetical protein GQ55_6G049800 [Panicum hallii var. hallii]|uniref:Uncharacterized protein n=1 Tax=Panicum hallii var. hallii TaxID=1504633 RepID=A0A2T7D3Y7_9POAL|nr:hypothetical protein GQ55_6G049800 [Panicum hallii var. hallii]